MPHIRLMLTCFIVFSSLTCNATCKDSKKDSPRIINIINFIRQTDYRLENSDKLLFETVQKQIKLVNQYDFPATFLLQYDALINPKYQDLLKKHLNSKSEVGAWWEITQPQVEAAGLKWRGEHSWVSTASIAFTPGYTIQEREKLVDVYMKKFKEIFGRYPRSVGSWFIDSHTLQYMYDKYGIVASCNCKDQVGTDGYTLWGGYWNQAYYPSKRNAYMPAQTEGGQIPVPIFRMLGSDPMYQYETGVGNNYQGVISLEPVYRDSGKSRKWVEYFLKSIVDEPCLAFNYAQAGQENSFTWDSMREGLEMQFPIFDSLRNGQKIRIETLEESGRWFKKQFPLTPATAITTLTDLNNKNNKSIWYNSRYYRSNLFWENNSVYFRDIHFFNEKLEDEYLKNPGHGNSFSYYTLPVVDRFHWSTPEKKVGLKLIEIDQDGTKENVMLLDPKVNEISSTILKVYSKDKSGRIFIFEFHEKYIKIACERNMKKGSKWMLELDIPKERIEKLPYRKYEKGYIDSEFEKFNYRIACSKGDIKKGNNSDFTFRMIPVRDEIIINCSTN